jgi:Alginate export
MSFTRIRLRWVAIATVASFSTLAPLVHASTFDLSGSVRVRHEYLDGQFRSGLNESGDLISARSLLAGQWSNERWTVIGQLLDARAYGAEKGGTLSTRDVNTLELVEAQVQRTFKEPFGQRSEATIQFGRFRQNLGSRRLIATGDYGNVATSFTGARTDLAFSNNSELVLFYALPQRVEPDSIAAVRRNDTAFDHEGFDRRIWGVLASRRGLLDDLLLEAGYVGFQETDTPSSATRNRNLDSFSLRLMRDAAPDQWDFEIEGIMQTGSIRSTLAANAARQGVNAHFLHFDIGRSYSRIANTRLSLEFDYASGDAPGGKNQRFDSLFGSRRGEFGPGGLYAALGRSNVQSFGLRAEFTPSKRLDGFLSARAMWAADGRDSFSTSGIRDATGAAGRFAGYQLDARLRYWMVPERLRLEVNSATLFKRGLLRHAPNAAPNGDTVLLSTSAMWSF